MANTYTQIHIQTIFVVQPRNGLIQANWEDELYKSIKNQKVNNRKKSFKEKYLSLLKEFDIELDERYIFKAIE